MYAREKWRKVSRLTFVEVVWGVHADVAWPSLQSGGTAVPCTLLAGASTAAHYTANRTAHLWLSTEGGCCGVSFCRVVLFFECSYTLLRTTMHDARTHGTLFA